MHSIVEKNVNRFQHFLYNPRNTLSRNIGRLLLILFVLMFVQGLFGALLHFKYLANIRNMVIKGPPNAISQFQPLTDALGIPTVVDSKLDTSLRSSDGSQVIATGFLNSYETLGFRVDQLYSADTYTRGALLLASALLAGIVLPLTAIRFARIWFVLGTMMLGGVGITCTFCTSGGGLSKFDNLSPVIACIAYVMVAIPIFVRSNDIYAQFGMYVVTALCIAPLFLIFLIPKACPFCAVFLMSNVVLLRFFVLLRTGETTEIYTSSFLEAKYVFVFLAAVIVSKIGMAAGVISISEDKIADYANLRNTPLSDTFDNLGNIRNGIVLVSLPHCAACQILKHEFDKRSIDYVELTECKNGQSIPCVKRSKMPNLVSPTTIIASEGNIQDAIAGWPTTPSAQSDFLSVLVRSQSEQEKKDTTK